MAKPMILEKIQDLVSKVTTNIAGIKENKDNIALNKSEIDKNRANISTNTSNIDKNKKAFDTHSKDDNRHWTNADRQNFDRVVHFKGYFVSEAKLKEAYPTANLGDYAIVGDTDTVWAWDDATKKWLNTSKQRCCN